MDGMTLLQPLMRMAGVGPEEMALLRQAGENRLKDYKALAHGGEMADGTEVPGQKALYLAVLAMGEKIDRLASAVESAGIGAGSGAPKAPKQQGRARQ